MRKNHSSTIVVCCFVWTTMKPCSWRGGFAQLRAQSTLESFYLCGDAQLCAQSNSQKTFLCPSVHHLSWSSVRSFFSVQNRLLLLLYRERTLLLIPSRNTFFFLGIRNSILSNTLLRPSGSDHWKHHRRECNETTMAMVNLAQEETKTTLNNARSTLYLSWNNG